ncbi:phage tail protein [Clostridium tertium]|uniref:major tail protein n=1 Tax=Clostridium tertium TaxID=1559 RepID=UPI00232E95A7|nr:major tail protein [Clostridium tertium]MDB1956330.1 phage tail protein [Clostridium tertium]MDB1958236.1 phage tail protein [Clostridium tertium]MDB1961578.1 phage tail protein [Clostridium tertium]MDB1967310.1 phage tail protein [Clostridium tertium]
MANRIVGLKNIHIAKLKSNGEYEAPIKLVGAKSVKTTNENNEIAFYSDDIMDYYGNALNAMSIEVEMAYLTPEIEALLTGKQIASNGAMITGANDTQATVAFMYEMSTLDQPIRRCLYEVILTKSESEASTKTDSIEEKTIKLTGKAKPRSLDGKFDIVMDANHIPEGTEEQFNQTFDKFFTGVLLPNGDFSPAQLRAKSK